jgi:hypothetical protein
MYRQGVSNLSPILIRTPSLTYCTTQRLAYFELRSILARMMWHFEIELDAESRDWMDDPKEFALWHKPPLFVKLKHRAD